MTDTGDAAAAGTIPARGPVPAEAFPATDADCAGFAAALGLPGYLDVHVHFLPERLQQAVWAFFDRLDDPPWPITYRDDEPTRLATLRELGVVAHPALAYGHRPGVAEWCNNHTLALAEAHEQVLPTFTFFPEDGVERYVAAAIRRGGRIAKVHLQVGRFHPDDPALDRVWPQLVEAQVAVVIHASAVYGVQGGADYCGPAGITRLLDRFPGLTLLVAHLGAPDPDAAFVTLAETYPGLYLDTAMVLTDPPYLESLDSEPPDRNARLAALARDGKLLFGSDFPTIPHPYAAQVRGLAQLRLDAAGLSSLLHDSAQSLLGR